MTHRLCFLALVFAFAAACDGYARADEWNDPDKPPCSAFQHQPDGWHAVREVIIQNGLMVEGVGSVIDDMNLNGVNWTDKLREHCK